MTPAAGGRTRARWERDSQVGAGVVAPLASFTLILADLAVAVLDAPSSCLVTGAGGARAEALPARPGSHCSVPVTVKPLARTPRRR